jgi:polyhydroxybutyrate depolymerase
MTLLPLLALLLALPACHKSERGLQPGAPAPDMAGIVDAMPADTADTMDAVPSGARPSAGCQGATGRYPVGRRTAQLTVGGSLRSFLIHVPRGHTSARPAPLLLLLHGGLGTGEQLEGSALFAEVAERETVVTVYPDGLSRSWNAGRCCGPPAQQDLDDVGFIAGLLDHLEAELCLDRRRIYASGMSNGAMLSHRLGCELGDRFAAIAPVAGTDMTSNCTPRRPIPVMQIHGTRDQHVPWEGGNGCGIAGVPMTGVPATVTGWLMRNGCTPTAPALMFEQGDGRCERQGTCPAGADVVLCTIAGAGHSWPGGAPKGPELLPACRLAGEGEQSRTFIASEQIWRFLAGQALP